MRLEYFQMVDRVVDLDTARRAIQIKAEIPETSTIFEGHFPGHPLMPGVLLIEAMAQASGWLIIALTGFERMPFLAAVKEAKLRQFVTPGTILMLEADIEHEGSGYTITRAKARASGKVICDATLTFRLTPFPDDRFRDLMRETASRIALPMRDIAHG